MSFPRRPTDNPEVFGPYLVYERLGVGGMATVHRAKERGIEGFERNVALKRLLPHLAEDEQFVRAFVREAKLASLLQHANIVQLYELGRVDHIYFISMELIEGRDLRKVLRQARRITGPPPIDVVVSLLIEICDALAYAHNRRDEDGTPLGLVHRDVSPSNVIVTEGHIKIIDFGIAKANTVHLRTATGRVKGKMAYMAPEATRGETLDARSDIFSAGVVAHELLTARPLFATKNDYQTLMRVQNAPVPPPSTYHQSCPPELDAIVLKALAKSQDERYESAAHMRDALERLRHDHRLSATSREVADWMSWAFALEGPVSSSQRMARVTPPSLGSQSRSYSGLYTPDSRSENGPPPPVETDDEVVEIAWGGRSENVPVLLDDVPDRSGGVLFERSEEGSDSLAAPSVRSPNAQHRGGTLLAYGAPAPEHGTEAPPPAVRARGKGHPPGKVRIASGTVPGNFSITFNNAEGSPRRIALQRGPREGSSDPLLEEPVAPRASTSPPILTPTSARSPSRVTPAETRPVGRSRTAARRTARPSAPDFGAAIVERERGKGWRAALAAALILGVAGAVFALTRGSRSKAAAASAATLKVVVEPEDSTIEIKGQRSFDSSPVRVELAAKSYTVEIRRDGYKPWTTSVTLEKNETQTLRVALARAGSNEVVQATKTTEPTEGTEPTRATATAPARPRDNEREHRSRRKRRPARDVVIADDTTAHTTDGRSKRSARADVSVSSLSMGSVEPPKASAPVRRAPKLVPPNAVRKLRGSPPHLRVRPGEAPPPARVSTHICIDRRGKVTSAKVLGSVSSNLRSSVQGALRRWRYRPYREAGERIPACFVVSFKTRH